MTMPAREKVGVKALSQGDQAESIKRGKWLLTLVAGTLLAVALVVSMATSLRAQSLTENSAEMQAVSTAQISAFRADDGAAAFSYAAPNIRTLFRNERNFMTMVKRGYSMIYSPVDYSFESLRTDDGRLIQPVVFAGSDLQTVRALYEMEQVDGEWKISGVFLEAIEDQMT